MSLNDSSITIDFFTAGVCNVDGGCEGNSWWTNKHQLLGPEKWTDNGSAFVYSF